MGRVFCRYSTRFLCVLKNSFYAKALSVKLVTSNKGKLTPCVDDVICNTSDEKFKLISMLTHRGYKALPLKRIYIPKSI